MITSAAMKNGFIGGLIVDFPNSKKAKKYFLYLMAGYSKEIADEAAKAINMPAAKEEGEDYSDSDDESDDEDEDMAGEEELKKDVEEESGSDEDEGQLRRKKQDKISFVGKRRQSKYIQKAKKKEGRFRANGNRKNKEWIMKKKDRQRRQGHNVKSDSKYSGRRRPTGF